MNSGTDAASRASEAVMTQQTIFVFQGGGALGAYQAGVAEALSARDFAPDWVAGVSIGAINAALVCGNPPEDRLDRMRDFWDRITTGPASVWPVWPAWAGGESQARAEMAAATVMVFGVPGFFTPRLPAAFLPPGHSKATSVYDTAPLRETLETLVDFDYLNDRGPRLAVGSVDIETGNTVYFDSADMTIGPEHVMASGALPPGFPAIGIEGRWYWDGGLVSNTPLQYVLESGVQPDSVIFQVDLFPARGDRPESLADVQSREKDIRYSSRTRLTTDRFRQLHALRAAADNLAQKLPPEFAKDPDLATLRSVGNAGPVTLVHLINRRKSWEIEGKDYEFSRTTMQAHWDAGAEDVHATLDHPNWQTDGEILDGLLILDLAGGK